MPAGCTLGEMPVKLKLMRKEAGAQLSNKDNKHQDVQMKVNATNNKDTLTQR